MWRVVDPPGCDVMYSRFSLCTLLSNRSTENVVSIYAVCTSQSQARLLARVAAHRDSLRQRQPLAAVAGEELIRRVRPPGCPPRRTPDRRPCPTRPARAAPPPTPLRCCPRAGKASRRPSCNRKAASRTRRWVSPGRNPCIKTDVCTPPSFITGPGTFALNCVEIPWSGSIINLTMFGVSWSTGVSRKIWYGAGLK